MIVQLAAWVVASSSTLLVAAVPNGSRTAIFVQCVSHCLADGQCHFAPLFSWLPWQSCQSVCEYLCTWPTISAFARAGEVQPKFSGKWAFIQVLGVQEPASALFSVLNLVACLRACNIIRQRLTSVKLSYAQSLVRVMWYSLFAVMSAAWICSSVFHVQDTPNTERLDYLGAYLVTSSLLASFCCYRVITSFGDQTRLVWLTILVAYLAVVGYHLHFIWSGLGKWPRHFDYGYNVTVNAGTAIVGMIAWTLWAISSHGLSSPSVRQMIVSFGIIAVGSLFEFVDFEPIGHCLDGHAVWHAITTAFPAQFAEVAILTVLHCEQRTSALKLD